MRLDRYLSQNAGLSRKEIKQLCKSGRVSVNSQTESDNGRKIDTAADSVNVDHRAVKHNGLIYLMMNKPLGYVSARRDHEHPTVLDLLHKPAHAKNIELGVIELLKRVDLQVVGRLDIDTSGLLLLTNDGKWNHRITSPNKMCAKCYLATCKETIAAESVSQFSEGVPLRGEKKPAKPAVLEIIDTTRARVSVHEGRYHLIKRLFAACQNHVTALHRESIGELALDSTLKPGDFRMLTNEEIALF